MPPTESLIQRHEETVDPTFDLFNLVTRKQHKQQQQQQQQLHHHTDDNYGRKINKLKSSRSLPDLLDMDACREGEDYFSFFGKEGVYQQKRNIVC